ncbi:glycosyltransferase N-terminal domain-containing protein [Aquimarina addita]|uniref:3-deoxy-D-manno-octulosonic acid transferase n=1 Tax=Aquimarina addita TaxID=870485 RepID=A0ABP6UNL7_9FLAO
MFATGRADVFKQLEKIFPVRKPVLWLHCASLGEYEQGVPVMEALKKQYPDYLLLVTFFSPSGYEVKKKNSLADVTVYLPVDTKTNAKKFVQLINPTIAVFVKYDFWPNYFAVLHKNAVPIVMVSAAFREDQVFFKWYGGFLRNSLKNVKHFFVQDVSSQKLLENIGFSNVTISGDTRFDRVSHQIEMDNRIDFISEFIGERLCIVIGSSWPEDEDVFIDFVNDYSDQICFIIAPHEIKDANIRSLQNKLTTTSVLFSEMGNKNLQEYQVFIMNTIGYLSRVYSYANIAYVGGAMGTSGLHNILEPATFGIPIIIGKNFDDFREAKQLQKLAGLFSIHTALEFSDVVHKLVVNKKFREQTGMISGHFINSNTGATDMIAVYLIDQLNQIKE